MYAALSQTLIRRRPGLRTEYSGLCGTSGGLSVTDRLGVSWLTYTTKPELFLYRHRSNNYTGFNPSEIDWLTDMQRRSFLQASAAAAAAGGLSGCIGQSGGSGDSGYTFMMSPSEPQTKMMAQYRPVKNYLSEEFGRPVSLKYASSYSAIIRALGSGNSHIAEMGALAAVLGSQSGDAEIVLQRRGYGAWDYSSVVVTTEDSDVSSLQDLEGKTIAFADMLSVSGSVYPLHMIKEAGVEVGNAPRNAEGAEFEATWSGHAPAFKALRNGQADAAGVGRFIALNDNREYKEGIEEVAITEGIPRAPIAVSPELSEEAKQTFVESMKEAPERVYLGEDGTEDTDDEEQQDDLWFDKVRGADAETYSSVVDVAQGLGIDIELVDQTAQSN